jgi:hypothetical protein
MPPENEDLENLMVPDYFTRQHIGIFVTIAGTVLLAFSVKIKSQYSGDMAGVVDKLKGGNPDLIEPTETRIVRGLFWTGLAFVAIGTLLQW